MNNTIIKFHDAELTGVETNGEIFIALKPICEAIGIDWERQRERLNEHPILGKVPAIQGVPSAGGMQETLCLPLDFIPGWLFTINPNQVSEAARPTLLLFQEHCFKALRDYFFGNVKGTAKRVATVVRALCPKTNHSRRTQTPQRRRKTYRRRNRRYPTKANGITF